MLKIIKDTKNHIISQAGLYFIDRIIKKRGINRIIDHHLPNRSAQSQYRDSDIILGLSYSIFSGSSYLEDLNIVRQQLHGPDILHLPSTDTVSYRISQLAKEDHIYQGGKNKLHFFNIHETLNRLLIRIGVSLNPEWKKEGGVIVDYDNTIITTTKGDSLRAYKGGYGYSPGVSFIGRAPVYVEGRNGNSPSSYRLADTVERTLDLLEEAGVKVNGIRIDTAAFQGKVMALAIKRNLKFYIRGREAADIAPKSKRAWRKGKIKNRPVEYYDQPQWSVPGKEGMKYGCRIIIYRFKREPGENLDLFEGAYKYYVIYTSDYELSPLKIIQLYNDRGCAEQNIERLKNDFNWVHPPYQTLGENTVYLLFTAIASVIYQWMLTVIGEYFKEIDANTRIKRFILIFVSLAAKWIRQGRMWVLKIYTDKPYEKFLYAP